MLGHTWLALAANALTTSHNVASDLLMFRASRSLMGVEGVRRKGRKRQVRLDGEGDGRCRSLRVGLKVRGDEGTCRVSRHVNVTPTLAHTGTPLIR